MDQYREIRFLIAPFVLLGSLLVGMLLNLEPPNKKQEPRHIILRFLKHNSSNVGAAASVLAAGTAAVMASGFVIYTMSILVARIVFGVAHCVRGFCKPCYALFEIGAPLDFPDQVLKKLDIDRNNFPQRGKDNPQASAGRLNPSDIKFIAIAFDHYYLKNRVPAIHEMNLRAWNYTHVCFGSSFALVLAFLIGPALDVAPLCWKIGLAITWLVLIVTGVRTRKTMMRHIEFYARLNVPPGWPKRSGSEDRSRPHRFEDARPLLAGQ